jgi:two-component system response regulator GlrR
VDLVLYVSSLSRYAHIAQRNFEELLARFDRRRVRFEVCDVSQHPERGDEDAICYTPMLVKRHPLPRTYVLGDLSNTGALIELLESCGVNPVR